MRQKEAPKRHEKAKGKGKEWIGSWGWIVRDMGDF
jgi:hypothetical protein